MSIRLSIGAGFIGLGIGVGFWSLLTLLFDGVAVYSLAMQSAAAKHPTTTGTVQESSSKVTHDADGDSYDLQLRYTYEVDGRSLTGTRYRYGFHSNSRQDVAALVKKLPAGSEVKVRYNPRDPADAVLSADIEPQDLFIFHFLTPFNCIMVAGWYLLGRGMWCALARPAAGWARVTEQSGRTCVDLTPERKFFAPIITLGALAFVTLFALAIPFGFNPPWLVLGLTWWLIAAAVVGVIVRDRLSPVGGQQVLILDQGSRVLELPPSDGRHKVDPEAALIPFAHVTDITLERVPVKKQDSGWAYAPTLRIRRDDGSCEMHELVQWQNAGLAQQLADWLRERILGEPITPYAAR